MHVCVVNISTILLVITTAAQNVDALSYHRLRGLYFLAVVFVTTILIQGILRCLQVYCTTRKIYQKVGIL